MSTTRFFQIAGDDLGELERVLPEIADALVPTEAHSPRVRTQLSRVKAILSNVRWNYGPPTQVERVGGQGEADQIS